jgi:hypothetical protein
VETKITGWWLVALGMLKNMKVNGKDYHIYYGKNMENQETSETTNQVTTKSDPEPGYLLKSSKKRCPGSGDLKTILREDTTNTF